MSRNKSKIPIHILKKWYLSGAIKQPVFPLGTLTVEGMGHACINNKPAFTTLSLGKVWTSPNSYTCKCYVVVPYSEKIKIPSTLDRLPNNSVPCDIFYYQKQ